MFEFMLECHLLMLFLILLRALFGSFLSAKMRYALWLFIPLRFLPFGLLFEAGKQTVLVNLIGKILAMLPQVSFARFDASAIRIPVWFMTVWTVGSVLVLVWQWFVNFRFEKKLYEEREKLPQDTAAYPVYLVNDIASSCAFKIHGEKAIYVGRKAANDLEVFQTVIKHETSHLDSGDLFFGKVRMLLTAVFFFSPIAWLAAVLSKRDCEMACDERTINRMGIAKEEYGKILLDLTVERLNTDVLFCHAVMISPSSYGLKARIRNVLSKQRNKKGQILMGILVVLFCAGTCFYEIPFLHNMNQEETIRQYVFYCNQEYFLGLKKICVPEKMDYFFHPKVTGKIVSLNKTSENSEEVLYQVVTEDKKGCKRKQSICLVQREQWKVKPWSEANVPFQYDVVKNKIRIKAYIGKEDVVSVPEKIEGKTVNEIQTGAFKNCNVKKITIPASVETIGSMAFFNLPDCEEITIGNKMALKSDDIFKRCPKLKEVNTKGKGTIVWFIGNSLIEDGNLDTYFQDICDQKKEPVIHYTNTGSGYMVMDHLNDFQKDLPETAYLTADVILIQPLHDYEAMMVSTFSDKCRKDAKIYSLGTIYTRYRNYCKFKNDFSKPLAGFTPGGDLCDDLVQRKILKHYDIQSMDEVHPTYLNGFISGASIYKELFHGKVLDIDYKKMSYSLDSFIPGKTDKEREEKMKEILDAAQKFDVKEYQKSGRGYYGYSEKIKRGA